MKKCVKITLKEYLNKYLKREVRILNLYWSTQTKLCLVLLYKIVKGSTNHNLIINKYSISSLLATQVFSRSLLAHPQTPSESKNNQVLFFTKLLLTFTNKILNEYNDSITLEE